MQVFTNQSSNGTSTEFKVYSSEKFVNIWVAGDLGGGTVQLESLSPDGVTWVPVNGGAVTEPQMITIESAPFQARLNLTGATTPNVNAWVEVEDYGWTSEVRDS